MSSAPLYHSTAAFSFQPSGLLFLSFSSRSNGRAAVLVWYSHQYFLSDSTVPVDLFTCMATPFMCLRHSLQHIAVVLCQNCGQDAWASGVVERALPSSHAALLARSCAFCALGICRLLAFFRAQWGEASHTSGLFGPS